MTMYQSKAASLTIGIPTVNSIFLNGYLLLFLLILCGFAIYDIRYKRVPNKALIFFAPIALMSPVVLILSEGGWPVHAVPLLLNVSVAMLGAFLGGGILLLAGLISGGGIGGGDIKLAAVLGFVYGPFGITGILLVAAPAAMVYSVIRRKRSGGQTLHLAFVPFILLGSFLLTAIKLFV